MKIKKIIIITSIIIAIFLLIYIFLFFDGIKNYKNEKFYTIGNEKIPTITAIVGQRKIDYIKSNEKKNIETKIIKYKNIKNANSDVQNYVSELIDNQNFINTTDINLNADTGNIKLAKQSSDKDKIILLTIDYKKESYTIKIQKGLGSIRNY